MGFRLRFPHLCLAVACACQALAVSPFALGQAAPETPKQSLESQSATQAPADEQIGFGDRTWLRREGYSSFLGEMETEEARIQRELQQGLPVPPSRYNWAKFLRISGDQEQAMRTLVSDASRRIKEINSGGATKEQLEGNPARERIARLQADGKELQKEREDVLDELIAKLRQELGEDGFISLDAYIYRTRGFASRVSGPADSGSAGTQSVPAPKSALEPQR